MFVESLSPNEARKVIEHYIEDAAVITIPGPGKHMVRLVRGFVFEDEDETLSLSMTETAHIATSRFSNSWLGKHLLGIRPRISYSIFIEDLIDPTQSRNILSMAEDHVATVFTDERLEEMVRPPTPDDIAFVNRALATFLFGREESGA